MSQGQYRRNIAWAGWIRSTRPDHNEKYVNLVRGEATGEIARLRTAATIHDWTLEIHWTLQAEIDASARWGGYMIRYVPTGRAEMLRHRARRAAIKAYCEVTPGLEAIANSTTLFRELPSSVLGPLQ